LNQKGMSYHQPVLLKECIELLSIQRDGIYIDATFGGGGHSRAILEQLGPHGRLIAFDQDEDAWANAIDDQRFTLCQHNFRHMKRFLRLYGVGEVDGVLADLGVSSHQLDTPERGFSFRFEADLDMRMGKSSGQTAAEILNTYSADELQKVFGRYGEVRNARTLAMAVVEARSVKPFEKIEDLLQVAEKWMRGPRNKYLAQVFQALRIEVNDEMGALEDLLEQILGFLKPGGRTVIMSYHSLEDRMVKNFLKTGRPDGQIQQDFYGNIERPFHILTKKALIASDEEVRANPRARSVRLRAGEKK
jgi:16S rRNA (cytosine1402-N4)-methyltransferase